MILDLLNKMYSIALLNQREGMYVCAFLTIGFVWLTRKTQKFAVLDAEPLSRPHQRPSLFSICIKN